MDPPRLGNVEVLRRLRVQEARRTRNGERRAEARPVSVNFFLTSDQSIWKYRAGTTVAELSDAVDDTSASAPVMLDCV